jgi:sugar phosphate isomerase/epimerase
MKRLYSLAQLIALPYNPPRLVQLAADTGADACGIRMLPAAPGGVAYPLMDDAALTRETVARIEGTGVRVLDLEIIRIAPDFEVAAFLPFMDVGQRIGARNILVAGNDADEARLTANFALLCEAAQRFGLTCDLEFMPWTKVPDVSTALRIVGGADRPNAGVLVDALHFARSCSTLDEVRSLPRERLHYAQICDGLVPGPSTTEGLIFDARCARLLPGEGGIDLRALFAALPPELPVSVEVPHDVRAPAMGYKAWAKAAFVAAQRVMEVLQ